MTADASGVWKFTHRGIHSRSASASWPRLLAPDACGRSSTISSFGRCACAWLFAGCWGAPAPAAEGCRAAEGWRAAEGASASDGILARCANSSNSRSLDVYCSCSAPCSNIHIMRCHGQGCAAGLCEESAGQWLAQHWMIGSRTCCMCWTSDHDTFAEGCHSHRPKPRCSASSRTRVVLPHPGGPAWQESPS